MNRVRHAVATALAGFAGAIASLLPAAPVAALERPATFSIVAYDSVTGELGVAVESKYFSVGRVVPWAEAGVGAVATQANVNPSFGPNALAMLAGGVSPEDILRSVKRGLYAVNFGGGQVDITNGKFVFSASEAYLIEDGKITAPVKNATLIGNGPDVLTRVSMVGNDLKLDEGVGTCGKDGQSVPVGVGIPTLKVDRLTVGGTGH